MKGIRLTFKDRDALMDAIDFISSNTDGADDRKPFEEMMNRLDRILRKLKRNK